jgi:hypothetical protein
MTEKPQANGSDERTAWSAALHCSEIDIGEMNSWQ